MGRRLTRGQISRSDWHNRGSRNGKPLPILSLAELEERIKREEAKRRNLLEPDGKELEELLADETHKSNEGETQ